MKTRCVIVDDEPLAARLINSYVRQVPCLETVAVCNNAIDAFKILQQQKVDIMFLDIKMPKMMGTDFLKSLPDPPKVIFVTAYRDYAVEGYEMGVADYLLKPVSFSRFMKAVAKATMLLAVENIQGMQPEFAENKNAFLYLKVGKEMTKILLDEIIYAESRKEYTMIYLSDKSPVLVKQSISAMEKLLSAHKFIRIHRSFIVTIEKVSSYTPSQITMGNVQLPIGRLYKNEVEKALRGNP